MQGTSCIGRVYEILREVYKSLGRESEWAAIEKCGRARDSDGLHVQQALIKNGWPAPTLGFVTDDAKAPGAGEDVDIHRGFLQSRAQGTYFGTPVSKNTRERGADRPGLRRVARRGASVETGTRIRCRTARTRTRPPPLPPS